ncbi:hypothetical protein AVEN_35607-1 [Araneus ventricosus]|uniref:Uncharacterized protein n=1 Tax=Araneus ventricosus TaxID=182803 RepID=A0A4Y2CJ49_ARAVE|nr:hypothetical protein AVEN_35607-1 [Araneus ventricosus]
MNQRTSLMSQDTNTPADPGCPPLKELAYLQKHLLIGFSAVHEEQEANRPVDSFSWRAPSLAVEEWKGSAEGVEEDKLGREKRYLGTSGLEYPYSPKEGEPLRREK